MNGMLAAEQLQVPSELGSGSAIVVRPSPGVFAHSECFDLRRDFSGELLGRDCLKLQFRLAGYASYTFGGTRQLELVPFDAAIVLDGSTVEKTYRARSGTTSAITLGCDASFLADRLDGISHDLPREIYQYLSTGKMDFYCASLPMTLSMIAAVRALLNSSHPASLRKAYFEAKIVELLCDLFAQIQTERHDDRGSATITKRALMQIESVRERIHVEYSKPLTVPVLAHDVGTNESKLSKLFKKHYGTTVHDYIRTVRLNRAKELLSSPDYSVTDVSFLVGYEHSANFATAFKRHFGVSPRDARSRRFSAGTPERVQG
ncbi:MAG: helix-turn-helix transcriptional regulator [Rudaea sp.]|uniref:helix-turn-helix transcriptional regulator n=1 Tax=unclassified Rudaea TaxID=2627037 RepID=UPI001485846B|nr:MULTISPECIES: AraC family transcriptional regulator [unclassified Rudaea]MBN8885033.1 helix-turn-helix transcriptional regulator [Rudaea sp.]MBR0347854.1 helix-turn-helix transcriptional regulator [Rudaea sp.]